MTKLVIDAVTGRGRTYVFRNFSRAYLTNLIDEEEARGAVWSPAPSLDQRGSRRVRHDGKPIAVLGRYPEGIVTPLVGSLFSGIGGWTPDSTEPDSGTASSPELDPWRREVLAERWPGVPSTTTYELWVSNQRRELRTMDVSPSLTEPGGFTQTPFLISSAEGSLPRPQRRRTPRRTRRERSASSSSSPESSTLFDPDGFSSRTYPVSSLATAVGTSESSLERWPTSGMAWDGGFSTAVSSECRSADGACSSSEPSLTEILEPPQDVPVKYSLSARAARHPATSSEAREDAAAHLLSALSL